MSLLNSKEFQQLLARTKGLGDELQTTQKQIVEMKRKIDGDDEDAEVAQAKAVNTKLQFRINHLKANIEEELEKDRRLVEREIYSLL